MHLVASPEEFRERVRLAKADNTLVVVDYFAPWCHACKSLHPQLQKLAAKYHNVAFLSVSHLTPLDIPEASWAVAASVARFDIDADAIFV